MNGFLQILIGAGVLGVLLTQVSVWFREHEARRRERNGLLRILYTELLENQSILRMADVFFHANMPEDRRFRIARESLRDHLAHTEAWEETRVKLAQHLPSWEFGTLSGYYSNVTRLPQAAEKDLNPDKEQRVIVEKVPPELVSLLYVRGQRAEDIIRKHVPDVATEEITVEDLMRHADPSWEPSKEEEFTEGHPEEAEDVGRSGDAQESAERRSWWRRVLGG
jgi:hypothetical protein